MGGKIEIKIKLINIVEYITLWTTNRARQNRQGCVWQGMSSVSLRQLKIDEDQGSSWARRLQAGWKMQEKEAMKYRWKN